MKIKIQYKIAPGYEVLDRWIRNLPTHFSPNGISIYKDRNEVKLFEEQGFQLVVKSFKVPHVVNRFAYIYLRGSKAARSYQNALKLLNSGISTPLPVAYLECISGGILKESYYVSLNYIHNFSLRDVLDNLIPDKQNILAQWVYFTWSHLHKQDIFHLDYSPGNTLIRKEDENYSFSIVDLNRMKFLPINFEKGIQNFRQLHADEETIRLIASEYAALCDKPKEIAIELLLKYDRSNKAFRRRKGNFHKLFTP